MPEGYQTTERKYVNGRPALLTVAELEYNEKHVVQRYRSYNNDLKKQLAALGTEPPYSNQAYAKDR
jgi:hypothetical protein